LVCVLAVKQSGGGRRWPSRVARRLEHGVPLPARSSAADRVPDRGRPVGDANQGGGLVHGNLRRREAFLLRGAREIRIADLGFGRRPLPGGDPWRLAEAHAGKGRAGAPPPRPAAGRPIFTGLATSYAVRRADRAKMAGPFEPRTAREGRCRFRAPYASCSGRAAAVAEPARSVTPRSTNLRRAALVTAFVCAPTSAARWAARRSSQPRGESTPKISSRALPPRNRSAPWVTGGARARPAPRKIGARDRRQGSAPGSGARIGGRAFRRLAHVPGACAERRGRLAPGALFPTRPATLRLLRLWPPIGKPRAAPASHPPCATCAATGGAPSGTAPGAVSRERARGCRTVARPARRLPAYGAPAP